MKLKRSLALAMAAVFMLTSVNLTNVNAFAADNAVAEETLSEVLEEDMFESSADEFAEDAYSGEVDENAEDANAAEVSEDAEAADGDSEAAEGLSEEVDALLEEAESLQEETEPIAEDELLEEEDQLKSEGSFTLDANGGVFPNGNTTIKMDDLTIYLTSDEYHPTQEGKLFTGWYAEPECTTYLCESYGEYYLKEEPEDGSTIYAGWTDYHTVTYVMRTGTGDDPLTDKGYLWDTSDYENKKRVFAKEYKVPVGKNINNYSPSSSYVRNEDLHYSFNKWFTDEARTKSVSAYSFTPTEDTTLYAGYKNDKYVLTLHATDENGYFRYSNYNYQEDETEEQPKTMIIRASKTGNTSLPTDDYNIHNTNPRMAFSAYYYDEECKNDPLPSNDDGDYYVKFDSDKDIYVKWAGTNKVVTFDLNSKTGYFRKWNSKTSKYDIISESVQIGTDGTEKYFSPGEPNNSDLHYKFLGWSKSQSASKPDQGYENESIEGEFTSDTRLYAVWNKTAYKVATFDAGDGKFRYYDNVKSEYVETNKYAFRTEENGEIDSYPNNPVPTNSKQVFAGWYDGSTKVENIWSYVLTKDTTFKAKYATAYVVTLNCNGGYIHNYDTDMDEEVTTKKVAEGSYIYLSDPKTNADKTFGGWYFEGSNKPVPDQFYPTSDVTVYAKWLNNYTVTFDCKAGKIGSSKSATYSVTEGTAFGKNNSLPNNPTANDSSKVFQAWYTDEDCTEGNRLTTNDILEFIPTENTTFYANYVNSYTVTFDVETNKGSFVSKSGGTYSVKVPQGESIRYKVPTVKSTDTYVFRGWFTKASEGDEIKNIYSYKVEGDTTLYAQFTECYKLTFHANQEGATLDGGTSDVVVLVTKGTAYRYGDSSADKDILFEAPKLDYSNVKTGNIPFVNNNGDDAVLWNTKADGSGDNYTLGRYNHSLYLSDGSYYRFNMYGFIPTSDMDFYARWGKPVKVIFDPNGGTFKKDSYYDNYGVLNAQGQRVLTIASGMTFNNINKPYSSMMETMPNGATSVSFYYSDKECKNYINSSQPITKNLTVYAKYSGSSSGGGGESTAKKIKYHAGEGYFYSDITRKVVENTYSLKTRQSTSIPKIDDPSRAFLGWYEDEALTKKYPATQFLDGTSWYIVLNKDVTDLYAKYGPAFTVKLDANGGYFDEDEDRYKDPSEKLRDVTVLSSKNYVSGYGINISDYTERIRRDGDKVFAGWYSDPDCKDENKAVITNDGNYEFYTPTENTTLYAKWVDYELPTKIEISKTEYTLSEGDTVTLKATITPESVAKTQDIHWYISSTYIDSNQQKSNEYRMDPITLTTDGVVTAQAAGTCTVFAEINGVRSAIVTIKVPGDGDVEKSITLDKTSINLVKNGTATVTATVTPAKYASQVVWSSADKNIADVVGDGAVATITAGSQEGETTITAKLGDKKATVKVTVSFPIKLEKQEMSVTAAEGKTYELKAILADGYDKVVWTSDDTTIAKVTADASDSKIGIIDPVDDIEETKEVTITAKIEGTDFTDVCKVTVRPIGGAITPTADVESGIVKKGTIVSLNTQTLGADIFYTVDGTDPATEEKGSTKLYTDSITIETDTTIKAVAYKEGLKTSSIATFAYVVDKDWGDIDADTQKLFEGNFDKVPQGIWYVIDGAKYTDEEEIAFAPEYDGTKLTFNEDITVFHNTRKLIENRDYTVAYANNTNAATAKAAKAPTVSIKGKGVYSSTKTFKFTIEPCSIMYADITTERVVTVIEGKTKLATVKPVLSFKGKKLAVNKDYELKYLDDKKADAGAAVLDTADKVYTISITGKGNFDQTLDDAITVNVIANSAEVVPVSKLKVVDVNGKAISVPYNKDKAYDIAALFDNSDGKATAFVKDGTEELKYDVDYRIKAPVIGTSSGKYEFVVEGIKKASGKSYVGQKTCTFEVKGTDLKKVKVAGLKTTVEFTGSPITITDLFNANDKTVTSEGWKAVTLYTVEAGVKKALVDNNDYFVEMSNTGVLGKFNVVFYGMEGYTGTIKKTVTVKAAKIPADKVNIIIAGGTDKATFVKTGAKPEVEVKIGDKALVQGSDYTVTYKNNTKTTKPGTVAIKGIGNYAGTTKSKNFTIEKASVKQISVVTKDVVYKANGKAGYFLVTPKLMDNGKAITAGKNKDVEKIAKTDYVYTYLAETKLEDGKTVRAAGEEVQKTDKIPADTTIVVSVPVKCSDSSPYTAGADEMLVGYYRIAQTDISKAKVEVLDKTKLSVNNGEAVKLTKKDLKVTLKGVELKAADYDIVSITDNKGVGKATLTIRGKGNYCGTKAQALKITAKSLK